MVSRSKSRIAGAFAGIAGFLVFLSSPAPAQQAVIVVQSTPPAYMNIERVPYADLNLLTRAGTESLHRRVSRAVERVCLYDNGRWYGLGEPDFNQCNVESLERRPSADGRRDLSCAGGRLLPEILGWASSAPSVESDSARVPARPDTIDPTCS